MLQLSSLPLVSLPTDPSSSITFTPEEGSASAFRPALKINKNLTESVPLLDLINTLLFLAILHILLLGSLTSQACYQGQNQQC